MVKQQQPTDGPLENRRAKMPADHQHGLQSGPRLMLTGASSVCQLADGPLELEECYDTHRLYHQVDATLLFSKYGPVCLDKVVNIMATTGVSSQCT